MLPAPSMAMPSGVWILAAIRLTVVAGVAVISSARNGVNLTAGDFADPGTGTHIYVPGGVYQDTFRVGYGGRCGRTALSGERLASVAGDRGERAGGAEFEDTVVVALGEVEITGRVESHAVRREEVHGGGGLAVASVGQFAMAGDGVHYVGLCESGGERRYPRQNCASKGLHKLSQMLERPRQEIKG